MNTDTLDQQKAPVLEPAQAAQLVSRQLNLAPESKAVQKIAARITDAANRNPTLRVAGPEGLKALIWAITPEDPARMDPIKQAQAMLARANITSGEAVVWGKVLESFRGVMQGGAGKEEGERRRSEASLAVLDLGKIDQNNFTATEFRAKGLDYGTFDKLRSQGFNAQQIIGAASFTKELKIAVKENAVAIARLQRDLPGVETNLRGSRDNWQAVGKIEDEAKKAHERGDNGRAEELDKQARETRERAERHDREEREHVQRIRPDRLPDLQTVQGHIKAAALHLDAAMPDAKPADAREAHGIFEAAHRHPEDANAQKKLEELTEKLPASSRRFLKQALNERKKVEVAAAAKMANTAQTEAKNDRKEVQKAKNSEELNDAAVALFADDPVGSPQQRAEATVVPARPTQMAKNTKTGKRLNPQQG